MIVFGAQCSMLVLINKRFIYVVMNVEFTKFVISFILCNRSAKSAVINTSLYTPTVYHN